jgi:hypothetical protein
VLVSLRLARLTACRAALQPFGCLRRHAFNALDLEASLWSAAARAVTAVRRALVVAMGWEEPAAAAALAVSRTRHSSATSSVLSGCAWAQQERGRVIDIRVISFGSWAVYVRPLALRARLATGVPLSGTCDGASGSLSGLSPTEDQYESCRPYAALSLVFEHVLDASKELGGELRAVAQ